MGKRQLVMDLLGSVVAFVLLFNVFAAAYVGFHDMFPWLFLLLALPFFGLFVLRRLIKNTPICIALNILCMALAFFIPSGNNASIMVLAFAVISLVFSAFCLDSGEFKPGFGRCAVIVILIPLAYTAFDFRENPQTSMFGVHAVMVISAVIIMAVTIVYMQMNNFDYNMSVYKGTGGKNVEKGVFTINNLLAWGFVVVAMTIAVLFVVLPDLILAAARLIVDAVSWLVGAVMTAVAWFMSLFLSEPGETEGAEGYELYAGDRIGGDEYDEHSSFWYVLGMTMLMVMGGKMAIGAVIGVFWGIFLVIRRIVELIRKKREAKEFRGFEQDTSSLQFNFKDLATFLPRFKAGSKHPVRRAYIRKVNFYIRRGVKIRGHHVPEDIAELVSGHEDIGELTEMYKAARYGLETRD